MTGNAMSTILRKIMEMRLNKEIADKSAKILIKEILRLYALKMAMYVRQRGNRQNVLRALWQARSGFRTYL